MLQDSDCPKCKKERRIQNKYDTLILQSTRDGEALEKRIVELEAEMKDHKEHKLPLGRENGEVCFLKDACLMEIADLRACAEWIRMENGLLLEKVEELQKVLDKESPSHSLASAFGGNTGMLAMSQCSPMDIGSGIAYCFTSCDDALRSSSAFRYKGVTGLSSTEKNLIRKEEMQQELKRERNLLLDVLAIMNSRRRFLEEVIPYIQRKLEKCRGDLEVRN